MIEREILPDIPRIYTALAEWLACITFLMQTKRRVQGWKFALLSIAALAAQSVFLMVTAGLGGIHWVICMLTAIFMMYIFLCLAANLRWRVTAYFCMYAFVLAEFAASLEWELDCWISKKIPSMNVWLHLLILIIVYAVVFIIAVRIYRPYLKESGELEITNRELYSCITIGFSVFAISNLGFMSTRTIFGGHYSEEIFNVRTLVDLGGAATMYAYHVQRVNMRVRQELEGVQNILHNQYVQYKQSREAMEVINYKYHDLKHHIIALRAEDDREKRNEYLDQMEEEIRDYETQNQTGNKILDVLLATKSLYCKKHKITLTSVVDGNLFEFMNAMDICSIFGNALDNAIECELKIQDKQKRLIHVSAYSQKHFLIIRFENYFDGILAMDGNFPLTTKKDEHFHGYGLKSIQYTVQKYDGAVNLSTQDSWFVLKILIPM